MLPRTQYHELMPNMVRTIGGKPLLQVCVENEKVVDGEK
jgi:hypothetical protein